MHSVAVLPYDADGGSAWIDLGSYISSINSKLDNKEIIKYFIKNKKLIRGFLGKNIKSRNVPELRFFYDDSNEIAEDIDKLFNSINKNKNWFYLLINQVV